MSQLIREIEVNRSAADLEENILLNEKYFRSKKISRNEFTISSNVAFGVFMINSHVVEGISIKAKLYETESNKTKITLSTGKRIGSKILLVLTASIMIIALVLKYFFGHEAPLFLILIIPAIPFWFRFIYLIQEKQLMDNVIKYVKLIERL